MLVFGGLYLNTLLNVGLLLSRINSGSAGPDGVIEIPLPALEGQSDKVLFLLFTVHICSLLLFGIG
jgi:hypothetical protein